MDYGLQTAQHAGLSVIEPQIDALDGPTHLSTPAGS